MSKRPVFLLVFFAVLGLVSCSDPIALETAPNDKDTLEMIHRQDYTRIGIHIDSLNVTWSQGSAKEGSPFHFHRDLTSAQSIPRRFIAGNLDLRPNGVQQYSLASATVKLISRDSLYLRVYLSGEWVDEGTDEDLHFIAPYSFDQVTGAIHVTHVPMSLLQSDFGYNYHHWKKNTSTDDTIEGIDQADTDYRFTVDILP